MAFTWASMSRANKLKVGCLIVKDRTIISDGFNGTPKGFHTNQCENASNKTYPEVLHAESNALMKLARQNTIGSDGATAYITAAPCFDCSKLLVQAGIKRVVYADTYKPQDKSIRFLESCDIETVKLDF